MAKVVTKNAYFGLGAGPTDYTSSVKAITLEMEGEEVDVTTLDDASWKKFLQGVKSATLTVDFELESDLSGLEKTIWDVFDHATTNTLAFAFRKASAAVGTTNPQWSGTLVITKPLNPAVKIGESLMKSVTWRVTGAITRATA